MGGIKPAKNDTIVVRRGDKEVKIIRTPGVKAVDKKAVETGEVIKQSLLPHLSTNERQVYKQDYADYWGNLLDDVKPDTLVFEKGTNSGELKISVWNERKK